MNTLFATSRAALAAALCLLLPAAQLPAQPITSPKPLDQQQRTLLALNRFTFGPRPGDVATVERMGLQKWFDQQLNPSQIDDSALDARLVQFPAMQMSIAELNRRYPGPQTIKQMENGTVPLPTDPMAHAIAVDSIAFYKLQKARQAEKSPEAAATDGTMAPARKRPQPAMPVDPDGPDRMDPNAKPLAAADLSPDAAQTTPAGPRLTPQQTQAILTLPPDQRMQTLLTMPAPQLARLRQSLRPAQIAELVQGLTPLQKETLAALPGGIRMVAAESMQSRLIRDIYSDRQLEAVMTDFWLNHFNVYVRKNQIEPYLIPTFERETIRPRALGNFEDLLVATAKSPAMLVYLDNWRSTGPDSPQAARIQQLQQTRPNAPVLKLASAGLNENYGRELMELHTLGVNGGGYTQADVTAVAKVFTGWTIDKPYQGGTYTFNDRRHEPGPKTVLGHTIQPNGEQEGLEVLHLLATSPATAHFICQKLAIRFVSDTPSPALVDRMARAFLTSHGDIKTVLRTLFASPELWAPASVNAKVKTPLEFVASAARASDLQITNAQPLVQSLDKLGMPLYGMQTPQGYSWLKDEWVSTGALVTRLNFALVLTGDRLPGTRTDWTQLLAGNAPIVRSAVTDRSSPQSLSSQPPSPIVHNAAFMPDPAEAEKERKLEALLLNAPVSERTRQTVLAQAQDSDVAEQAATQFDLSAEAKSKKAAAPKGFARKLNEAQSGPNAGPDDPQAAVMAGLLLGSPEFQRR